MTKKTLQQLTRTWSRLLVKALKDYAKSNTKTWYGTRFSSRTTPFAVAYSKRKNAIFVQGNPPNKNVDKHHKVSKRVPWGKTTEASSNASYNWHGEHYHRVFISDTSVDVSESWWGAQRRSKSSKGFWFTAKKKWEDTGAVFYTKKSHYNIDATKTGYTRSPGKAGRSYTFPAQWKFDTEGLHFDYHYESVSDKVMSSPELPKIIDTTLNEALSKVKT